MPKLYIVLGPRGELREQLGERHDGRPHKVGKRERLIEVDRHSLDPHCETFDEKTGEWMLDTAKRSRLDEEARLAAMTGPQVYAELRPMIDALSARVSKLEGGKS